MNLKILALLLFVIVILPIVFSKSKNNATKSSESPKSGKSIKSKNNATKSSESPKSEKSSKSKNDTAKAEKSPKSGKSTKKHKPIKRKPSKCKCKPKKTQNQRIYRGEKDESAPYQILIEIRDPINYIIKGKCPSQHNQRHVLKCPSRKCTIIKALLMS